MQDAGSQLELGAVIGGYRIDALISRGGMGVVYRATNVTLGQTYALKVLAPALAADDRFRERFRREIRLAASLHHPHAVGVHYAGEDEGRLFLAMDFIDGTDLREVIQRDGALEPDRAVALVTQVASALDAAHAKGLVHRDIKPANVLLSAEDGEEHAYLTDFGIAKRVDTNVNFTAQGLVLGTVDYMPPEQITGATIDARADIYALGCVLFQMLTGRLPYVRDNTPATMFAHVYEPPPSLRDLRAGLPSTFDAVVAKAMAKEPADRYLSAGDLARDAAAALRGMRYTGAPTIVATGEARPQVPGPAAEPVEPVEQPQPAAVAAASTPDRPRPEPTAPLRADRVDKRGGSGGLPRVAALPGGLALAAIAGVVIAVIALSSGSSPTKPPVQPLGQPQGLRASVLAPVPSNQVTGTGSARVQLTGNVATVTVTTTGLLGGAPHAMHIHAGGLGQCPPASAARPHNGHLSISTTDGIHYYGPPATSLTTTGDTSPRSIVDFTRYPSTGNITYTRTIPVERTTAAHIRENSAAIIVHGIDYNGNGIYDNVLDRSELNPGLPGEATAPALCGVLSSQSLAAASRSRSHGAVVYTATLYVDETHTGRPSRGPAYLCHPISVAVPAPGRRPGNVAPTNAA